jgi:predicted RNA-binding protein YlxR (DUF448 family)
MKGRARLRQTPNEGLSGPDTVERQAAQPQSGGRGGAKQRGDHEPERKCVLSGAHGARDVLIRLALGPDGKVAPDVRARAAGRGAWIGVDRARLEEAQAKGRLKGALARAFKTGELIIADDLGARIEAALRQALLDRLGLEARAGTLITGSEKIETAARRGDVHLLLHAADAGADGSGKLDQALRMGGRIDGDGDEEHRQGLVFPAERAILSLALGRQNVVHIAIIERGAAARVRQLLDRWRAFIGPVEGSERFPPKRESLSRSPGSTD